MFAQETTLFRFMLGYLQNLMADFDERELNKPVAGAINPPAYILGHLAISNDFTLQLLGQANVCPPEWHAAFGPGSTPDGMEIAYPSKQELLDAIQRGHARVCESVKTAMPEPMSQPQNFPFFAGTPIKTVGDCVALLMTTHFSLHIGQLSLMRRQCGRPPLF